MIPSTLFAIVAALSSFVAVNGAVIQRDGTFTYLTPQPTAPGQAASTTTTTTATTATTIATTSSMQSSTQSTTTTTSSVTVPTTTQSSSVTSTRSTTPTSTGTTTSATVSLPTTTPSTTTQSSSATSTRPTTSTVTTSTDTSTATSPSVTQTSPSGTVNCNGVQQWQASLAYTAGNRVIFNGQLFTASQWTYNNAPPTHADQWIAGGICAQPINNKVNCNGVAAWQSIVAYTAGNQVIFNGHLWSAVQWTESNAPGDTSGSWKDQGACA